MGKPTKNFKYVYERMVPPGKLVFFFTGNKMQTHSLTYPFYDDMNPDISVSQKLIFNKNDFIFIYGRELKCKGK